MAEAHPLILSLRSAGLKDVDTCNLDEVHNMWAAFSRAKNCIDGGDRLEYLSWRIYSREILARKPLGVGRDSCMGDGVESPPQDSYPSEVESSGSDSEYETYSEDSDVETAEQSSRRTSIQQRDAKDPKGAPREVLPSAPQLVPSKRTPVSITNHPHRRISSLELQHLFKDTPRLNPSELKKCTKEQRHHESPEKNGSPREIRNVDSSVALNAYHTRFGSAGAATQTLASKESKSTPKNSVAGEASDGPGSTAVRGFSSSSVSVSVSMNHGLAQRPESKASDLQNDNNLITWKKASLPREKIFFIEAESDSDASSTAGSPNNDQPTRPHKDSEKHVEITDDATNITETNDSLDVGLRDNEDDAYSSSGWDDTSGEDDDDDSNDDEDARNLFKERAVPMQPLLKRSLLSSLFVNNIKEQAPAQKDETDFDDRDTPSTQMSGSPQSDKNKVTAPVDILLGAAVAPHIPLPAASPRTVRRDMVDSEMSQSLRDHIRQSRHYDVDLMFRTRPSNSRSFSDSAAEMSVPESSASTPVQNLLHITARPEMYRASTDNGVSYRRPSEERTGWQSQHEDIYDPMNYHSRGW